MSIVFRRASADDADVIIEFNRLLAAESEQTDLDPNIVRRGVERGSLHFPEVRYFVAETHGRIVGQMMMTREWSDWRDGWLLWLQSVYVDPDFRRQGVFRRLLNHSLAECAKTMKVAGVRLYVEKDNVAATSTYLRSGFKDSGYRVMEIVPLHRENSARDTGTEDSSTSAAVPDTEK